MTTAELIVAALVVLAIAASLIVSVPGASAAFLVDHFGFEQVMAADGFASLAREVPDPTADDAHIRERILREINATGWRPAGFQVWVRNGAVHLHGLIFDERARHAAIVLAENTSGVKEVHDHLCFVDGYSGYYVESPEDIKAAS